MPRLQVRRDFVFRTADRNGIFLEIGPAHNAILPKRDGYDTRIVDYLDRDGLIEKYREFKQYSPDDIEEVDYVIPAGALMSDVIDERFDLVLASHVLEHSISLIDFLNDCTRLLAPNGVLSLVVPDHRYCFDRFRERSSIGRVIDTSISRPSVHTVGTLTEFSLNAVMHRGTTSWSAGHSGRYQFVHDLDAVRANAERAEGDTYIDVHNWVFSPNHLRLMLQDLHTLGLITVREAAFQDTIGNEFFLNLTLDGPGSGLTREELVVLADAEQTATDVPVFEPTPDAAPTSSDPAARVASSFDPTERDGMRFVVTVMVRDEVDIIAAWVEHHLAQGADLIIATDNGSVDGTTEVLQRYADLGLLELHHDPVFRKQQHAVVTDMARRAYTEHAADWVINADADEFWIPCDRRLSLRTALEVIPLSLNSFKAPVTNLVGPPAMRGSGIDRLLWRDRRTPEELHAVGIFAQPTGDVVHRGDGAVTVRQGNHWVSLKSAGQPDAAVALEVLHLPWRSWLQFERKVVNAGRAYEANPGLRPSPNHHGMADYRRQLAGRLWHAYLTRQPLTKDLAAAEADGAFVYDPWLRDHLHALAERALAPDLFARCLDASEDEPIDPAEHERAANLGRLFVDLERERDEARVPLPLRDDWLRLAQRTVDRVRGRSPARQRGR